MSISLDEELIREVKNGQISSFEKLVKRYQKRLSVYIRRFAVSDEDTQDILQKVFISVYRHITNIDEKRGFSSYIYAVAKNESISHLRQNKPAVSLNHFENLLTYEGGFELFEKISKDEIKTKINIAISKLAPLYRQIIKLYYFDDLSYQDIADKVKMPINTVRTRLRRAKVQLKTELII